MDFIEPCFGIGHNLSLICQMTSEDIKHQLIIITASVLMASTPRAALLGLQIVHASRPPYFCAAHGPGRSVLLKAVSQCMGRSNRNYIVLTLLSHMKSSTKRRVNNDAVNTRRIIIWVFAENARCLLYSHLGFPIWEWLSSKGMDTISYRSKTLVNFGV